MCKCVGSTACENIYNISVNNIEVSFYVWYIYNKQCKNKYVENRKKIIGMYANTLLYEEKLNILIYFVI